LIKLSILISRYWEKIHGSFFIISIYWHFCPPLPPLSSTGKTPTLPPMKAAFISIIGRPSAGKSTLINALCGEKVSIVSPVPQTTRNAIRGILTRPEGQLVFVDTPGYHHSDKNFNLKLKDVAEHSLEGIDLVLYLLDTTRPPGPEEESVAELLAGHQIPVLVGLNKTDNPRSRPEESREWISHRFSQSPVLTLSALTGEGVPELLAALYEASPEGDLLYPEDIYTDQEPDFRIKEVIREKAIARAREELPHALYVEVADMEMTQLENGKSRLWVRAFLMVERDSQKGILVGQGGKTIKEIRLEAQKELNELFPYRVNLDLMVKVKKNWRHNESILKDVIN